jgi:hypothetical protein
MGRWFGYRPGYIDLCRLYTTDDLVEWFEHIADASEELREEFDLMAASRATPREYGLKVQSHPVLMVTSRLKMRTAKDLNLSFSGELVETVTFYRDREILERNLDATRKFVRSIGKPEIDPKRARNGSEHMWTGYLWEGVSVNDVIDFLIAYRSHPEAHKVNSALLAEFIQSLVSENELTHWTVALIGGGKGQLLELRDGVAVEMLQRSAHGRHPDRYSIGRLMSPRDEAIDLDEKAWKAALDETHRAFHADPGRSESREEPSAPNGPAIRKVRGFGAEGVPPSPDRGVIFLYAIDPDPKLAGKDSGLPPGSPAVIGFAISFPASHSGAKVKYKVNNILWKQWEQDYGSTD